MDSTTDAIKKKSYKFFVKGKKSKGFSIFFFFFFFEGDVGVGGVRARRINIRLKLPRIAVAFNWFYYSELFQSGFFEQIWNIESIFYPEEANNTWFLE